MYTPAAFVVDDIHATRSFLRARAFGHLVSVASDIDEPALQSTPLPFAVADDVSTVRAHVARGNPHWRSLDGTTGLLIVPGVDAYVSPSWYPSKAEHHRVVPTWNYEVVHLRVVVSVRDDDEWKLQLVNDQTDHNERSKAGDGDVWRVEDAPADFIARQLRAIVGLELRVTGIQAKRKLSQNRSESDRAGAANGLSSSGRPDTDAMAALMRAAQR